MGHVGASMAALSISPLQIGDQCGLEKMLQFTFRRTMAAIPIQLEN
jgi:hypothetical protein